MGGFSVVSLKSPSVIARSGLKSRSGYRMLLKAKWKKSRVYPPVDVKG